MRRIEVSPAAVSALCLLFYLDPRGAFCPFVLAAAAHEAGHLVALCVCGSRVRSLRLGGTGAVLAHAPLPWARQLACTLAGPAVNCICALCFARLAPRFAIISALLAAYNLLPVEPLDGGNALRALAERLLCAHRAQRVMRIVRALTLGSLCAGAAAASLVLRAGIWPLLLCAALLSRLPREKPVANWHAAS